MKKITIIFTLILTAFAANSRAQFTGGVGSTWNNPVSAQINRSLWNNLGQKSILTPSLRKMGCTQDQINKMTLSHAQNALAKKTCTPGSGATQNAQSDERATSPSVATRSVKALPAAYSTTFSPTGTRIVMSQIVAQITPNDRALQQKQIDFLESLISQYESKQRSRGYGDDVAAAMAFFASIGIHLQDTRTAINQKGVDSLTDALRVAFGDKLADASDREKQQLYESLLILGMFINEKAQNSDAKTRVELKQLAESLCEQFLKLDVTKYRFDDNGLVEIGQRSSAID